MNKKFLIIPTLIICFFAQTTLVFGQVKSTLDDQESVEVTVYNNGLGLVKDTRKITLDKGTGLLQFMDVASAIMPVTVLVESLNNPNGFKILEQNYEYDLMNQNKLLDKYVGKNIKIIDHNRYTDEKETIDAKLLSNNGGQIFEIGDEIYLGHSGYKVLPEIPEDLIAKPTLSWMYYSETQKPHTIQASYLTNNISWKADYVLAVNSDDTLGDISGWVTLDNKSGTTYKDAKLKLVAGDVNRAQVRRDIVMAKGRMAFEGVAMDAVGGFAQKSFFEYHIYDLARPTTIKNNQTKQVNLLNANNIMLTKEYQVHGNYHYFYGYYRGQNIDPKVEVYMKFKNEEDNNLGMPIPEGIIRLYKEDESGSRQFIGEDNVEHTPKDEEIELKMGNAFDLVAKRKQTDYKNPSTNVYETAWEITLRNHKEDEGVVISVIEPLQGDWEVINTTHEFEKIEAFKIKFNVPVAADEEVKVKYRVRVTNR